MQADNFFIVGRNDQDRAQKSQRLQTQPIGPLYENSFLKAVFAFRSGIIDLRERAQRAELAVALGDRLDQFARFPDRRGQLTFRRRRHRRATEQREGDGRKNQNFKRGNRGNAGAPMDQGQIFFSRRWILSRRRLICSFSLVRLSASR